MNELEAWLWVMWELEQRYPDRNYPTHEIVSVAEGLKMWKRLDRRLHEWGRPTMASALRKWTDRELIAVSMHLSAQAQSSG